jgi:branched-chain amino acid transport system substrate-binding protein
MRLPHEPQPPGLRRLLLQSMCLGVATAALPALAQSRAGDKGDILIGRSTALSGPMAPFLAPIHQGQEAALADFNAAGGVAGRKVQLMSLDDGFEAPRSLENARKLVQESGVVAMFGQAGTSQVLAQLPLLEQTRTPLVGIYTGSPAVRLARSPWLFTTNASYSDEMVKIIRNLVAIQTTRIGVAYENNDFGKLALPLVEKAIAAEGATLVGAQPMQSSGQDADSAAKALAALQPQAVVMIAAGPPVVAYVRAHKANLGVPVYTLSLGAGAQAIRALGDDARGLAVARTTPSPTRLTTKIARDFQASMKQHGHPADYDRFVGYLDARVLIEGLRAAGPNVSGPTLATALEGLHRLDLGGHTYQFSAQNRNGSNFVDIAVIGPGGTYMH